MSERPSPARVLVLGIGNPDRGDDGIGVEVATKLDGRLPVGVRLLACRGDVLSLVDEVSACEALVCADAAAPMGEPGRIHRLDLAAGDLPRDLAVTSSHAFGLAEDGAVTNALLIPLAPVGWFGAAAAVLSGIVALARALTPDDGEAGR